MPRAALIYSHTRLILTSLLIFFIIAMPTAYAQEKEPLAQLDTLRKNMNALIKELESTKERHSDLEKTLEKAEKNIGKLSKKAEQLEKSLEKEKSTSKKLKQEQSQLIQQIQQQQSHVAQHINDAYRLGKQSNLRVLLSQQDPAKVTRNVRYHDYIIAARAEKVSQHKRAIERLNTVEDALLQSTQKLERQYQQLQAQRKNLKQAQGKRQHALASLSKDINQKDQRLVTMKKNRQRLEMLLSRVEQYVNDIELPSSAASFSSRKGKLPWPAKGKARHAFGQKRMNNALRWQGIMIASPLGNPVLSVHHGRVVFAEYLRGHGLLIIVDHGANFMTLYAHNQTLSKELGEWVNAGEKIAAVGNSGGQKEPGLYFELRHKGKPTNPKLWLTSA